ncbi:unnamed protein product [Angiostrongylus costaricensis]|uniref:Uncharacterized protein n=1 Tax=Angiostrongylus costaricensis TaxID=334426 RepID=A0A0R3PDC8_ANGCS|nr:unnamed protein product [Angiostrongylus costaricensis]
MTSDKCSQASKILRNLDKLEILEKKILECHQEVDEFPLLVPSVVAADGAVAAGRLRTRPDPLVGDLAISTRSETEMATNSGRVAGAAQTGALADGGWAAAVVIECMKHAAGPQRQGRRAYRARRRTR